MRVLVAYISTSMCVYIKFSNGYPKKVRDTRQILIDNKIERDGFFVGNTTA